MFTVKIEMFNILQRYKSRNYAKEDDLRVTMFPIILLILKS
jgi:hypothetical protein